MLSFRHFLGQHELTAVLFEAINAHLKAQGLLVSKGTVVDATLIHAPSLTKNREQARGPKMRQTKKRESHGTWHEGADVDLEAVHTVEVTVANEADINVLPKLLRVEDDVIFSDAGCTSDEYKRGSRQLGIRWCVQDKLKPGQSLRESQKKRNRKHFAFRARVEHVFRAIKR